MKNFKKKGFISKEMIITLIVITTIGLLTFSYLINSKKTNDLKNQIDDLAMTIHSTYNKVKLNGDVDQYNLKKIFNQEKGIFNILKKKYEKALLEKNFTSKIEGIVFYNGGDTLNLGSDSIESSNSSFISSKINQNLKDNEVGFLIGIEDDTLQNCDGYGISNNDKVLTVFDTIQNSDGVNDPILDICRGGVDGNFIKYFILVFKNEDSLNSFNTKYLEGEGKKINITDGTNNLNGLVIRLKNKSI